MERKQKSAATTSSLSSLDPSSLVQLLLLLTQRAAAPSAPAAVAAHLEFATLTRLAAAASPATEPFASAPEHSPAPASSLPLSLHVLTLLLLLPRTHSLPLPQRRVLSLSLFSTCASRTATHSARGVEEKAQPLHPPHLIHADLRSASCSLALQESEGMNGEKRPTG